ncbi:RNA exonuclease 4 [Polyodon spathula]|uniref:RNA exonuclease 4 n=1 Tax=Polyodon spathula TaxID=7913 RepID=UPI001B7E7DF6|nr:RNA exonuclease 4 [Polyodon spathula]
MSQVAGTAPDSTPVEGTKHNNQKTKNNKKKQFRTAAEKGATRNVAVLPPKASQQFSANWKVLQELLNQNKATTTTAQENGTTALKHNSKKKEKKLQIQSQGIPTKDQVVKVTKVHASKQTKGDSVQPRTSAEKSGGKTGEQKKGRVNKKRTHGQITAEGNNLKNKKRKTKEVVEHKPTEADIWFDDVDPDDIEAAVGTEAADIARKRVGVKQSKSQELEKSLVKDHGFEGLTKAVAMDCEMVGVGQSGEDSIVARVSIVNHFGKCIYDKYVKPTEKVTDYRTAVSGIRPQDFKKGINFKVVQREVADIIQGRILVGHAVHNDLKILFLDHPKRKIRDTQKYKPFKAIVQCGRPSLKLLSKKILNVKVQEGEHSSVQDAQATMKLYTSVKKRWEAELKARHKVNNVAEKEGKKGKGKRPTDH